MILMFHVKLVALIGCVCPRHVRISYRVIRYHPVSTRVRFDAILDIPA